MKKFLTVLLVIAVMFTFSFGSAFATSSLTDKEKDALNIAYSNLTVGAYSVNYDSKYADRTSAYYTNLPDLTAFSISATYMQKAVDEAYTAAVTNGTLPGEIDISDYTYDTTDSNRANGVLVAAIKAALVDEAQTSYLAAAEAAAFDEYKTMLKGLVESIDLSNYTTTEQDEAYNALDGEQYKTAAAAAAADKAYLLNVVEKATFSSSGNDAANATAAWSTTYEKLYAALFGESGLAKVVENKDDALDASLVTSLSYALKGSYATTKSEAAAEATSAAAKATALAKLTQAVTDYENGASYSSKQDAGIAAYVEAMTYLIENDLSNCPESYTISSVEKNAAGNYAVNSVDYVARCAEASKIKTAQETAKTNAGILGTYYDEVSAAKLLKAKLITAYKGTNSDSNAAYTGESNLTAGQKAAAKIDLSDISAQGDIAKYYTLNLKLASIGSSGKTIEKSFYAKEWESVKTAVDAYNASVDAATTASDISDAEAALDKALAKITMDKTAVENAVNASTTDATLTQLGQYFALTKSTYNTANSNSENIYINWGEDWESSVENATVVDWFIAQGARSAKEAAALYGEATKVIDAYKSATTAKADAAAVKAQIAALPTSPTLDDKAAVMGAYDAYKALPADVQVYVTNDATLKSAINAVHVLERNAVVTAINSLPSVSKVTTENKDAIKAVIDAFDEYDDTDAYGDNTFTGITKASFSAKADYKAAVKAADLQEIQDLYNPLSVKYSVDALTAADAEAIAKLQKAIEAYIAEYEESPGVSIEYTTEKMAAVVSSANAASVESLKITASSTAKKGSITVKWSVVGDTSAVEGYEIWKSTKKSSGYKKAFTQSASKTTYKNTKGLKKGTRYYYKVRAIAYTADGTKVKSDWSNKAYRIAK